MPLSRESSLSTEDLSFQTINGSAKELTLTTLVTSPLVSVALKLHLQRIFFTNEFSKLLRSYEPKIAPSRLSRLLHNGCQAQPQDELLLISQR